MGVVTSGLALREPPPRSMMKSDCLIRGKQKCCQSGWRNHQRRRGTPMGYRWWKDAQALTLLLMVSKCSLLKVDSVFSFIHSVKLNILISHYGYMLYVSAFHSWSLSVR